MRSIFSSTVCFFLIIGGLALAGCGPEQPSNSFESPSPSTEDHTVPFLCSRSSDPSVCNALVQIYKENQIDFDAEHRTLDVCQWNEVFCYDDATIKLYLGAKNIEKLPSEVFQGLLHLRSLNLSSNRLTSLGDGMFGQLTNLKFLDLSGNQIVDISEQAFAGSLQLKGLFLSGNRLKSLPEGLFKNCARLQILDLSFNQLTGFSRKMFTGLTAVTSLDLSSNPLKKLSLGVFDEMPNLEELFLNNNELDDSLPNDLFDTMKNLYRLIAMDNLFTNAYRLSNSKCAFGFIEPKTLCGP